MNGSDSKEGLFGEPKQNISFFGGVSNEDGKESLTIKWNLGNDNNGEQSLFGTSDNKTGKLF